MKHHYASEHEIDTQDDPAVVAARKAYRRWSESEARLLSHREKTDEVYIMEFDYLDTSVAAAFVWGASVGQRGT